jgi:hypothetical protein
MTSSPHDPYGVGDTRGTMVTTMSRKHASGRESPKGHLSSEWFLQLETMKVESLVIVDQHATVNRYLSLVLPARHARGVVGLGRPGGRMRHVQGLRPLGSMEHRAPAQGSHRNRSEVVTR